MYKLAILLTAGMLTISNLNYAQQLDTAGFNNYKKFMPYMIKGMAQDKPANITDLTSNRFDKPWEVEKLSMEESKSVLDRFLSNSKFEIKKDYNDDWKLRFFSKIEDLPSMDAIYKSNAKFSNIFVSISNIEIVDTLGNFIYEDGSDKRIRNNLATDLDISSSQISTSFLIGKKHETVEGGITLSLKEFQNISFKEFHNSFDSISFDLGEYKNLTLIKVQKNRAYVITPTIIEDLEIRSSNEDNEMFVSNIIAKFPIRVFEFGQTKNTDDDAINKFIETLTIDEVSNGSQVIVYETNGVIKNLYIYLKSDTKILATRDLKIKL